MHVRWLRLSEVVTVDQFATLLMAAMSVMTLVSLSTAAPAAGAAYYVAPTGSDGDLGTAMQPWRTIQHAADVMGPGDVAYVRGGGYNESVTLTRSGLPGAPITFSGRAGETAILDGQHALYAGFTTDSNVDVSDVVIANFTIRDFAAFGIVAWSTNNRLTLRNLVIRGNGATGIRLSNSDGARVRNVLLQDNVGGFDCTPILPGAPSDPGCTNLRIRDTQAIDNGTGNDTAVDAFAVERGDDIVVKRALAAGGPGDGFDFKSNRTTLARVIAHDARNNIKLWGTNAVLVNALAYNATADANLVLAGGGSYTITNVTIANMTGYAYLATFGDGGTPTPVRLHNAIFSNDNPAMGGTLVWFDQGVALTSDNNLYFNPYRTDALVCASFPPYAYECFSDADLNGQTAHPWIEGHSRAADPRFVNSAIGEFSLQSTSPAIDVGTMQDAPAIDLAGRRRPQGAGIDLGAYEYASAATPTATPSPTRTRSATPTATRTRRPTRTATRTPSPTPTAGAAATPPVVPVINAAVKTRLRSVFLAGQVAGNRPGVFAKVGDSISESDSFLKGVGCGEENLGSHVDLAPVIAFFRGTTFPGDYGGFWCGAANSFTRNSATAVTGWSADYALGILDPPVTGCPAPYNTPLRCELHLLRPSMAVIMYGTNDLERYNDLDFFRHNLTQVVTETLGAGVIPILSTIPPRLDAPALGARVAGYNQVVIDVAQAQQVPLVNYWLAMVGPQMINQGVSSDGVHPNLYGECAPDCLSVDFTDQGLRYGYNQRNLTAIQAFGKVKAIVIDDAPPDGGAGATDPGWNDEDLNQLKIVPGSAFELVQLGPILRP